MGIGNRIRYPDTPTVNDEWWKLIYFKLVPMLTRLPFRLESTVARLKPKKLVGLGANEVKHVI